MLKLIKSLSSILIALSLLACTGTVREELDPNGSATLGIMKFTPQDIDKTVSTWLQSLVSSEPIVGRNDRPTILFADPDKSGNRTNEHIDMQEFQDAFEIAGLKSGKIRFTSAAPLGDQIIQQMKLQQSDLADPKTTVKFGKMKGWPYSLYVQVFSPTEPMTVGRKSYLFYRAVLKLVNNETFETEWSDEQKFLRSQTPSGIGR